jgi:hypothetical protein
MSQLLLRMRQIMDLRAALWAGIMSGMSFLLACQKNKPA